MNTLHWKCCKCVITHFISIDKQNNIHLLLINIISKHTLNMYVLLYELIHYLLAFTIVITRFVNTIKRWSLYIIQKARERGREREGEGEREGWERERGRERGGEGERGKGRERGKVRERERKGEREGERVSGRERGGEMERERGRGR